MADIFIEHMITRKLTPGILLQKAGLLAAAFLLGFLPLFLTMFELPVASFLPITLVAAGWGFSRLNRRTNLEFEYIVTNGELDVDKILGKATRKRLLTVDCRNFEILAPLREEYTRDYQNVRVTVDASSSPQSQNRWFAVFPAKDAQRTLLIFEPNDKMMDAFRLYIRSKIKA